MGSSFERTQPRRIVTSNRPAIRPVRMFTTLGSRLRARPAAALILALVVFCFSYLLILQRFVPADDSASFADAPTASSAAVRPPVAERSARSAPAVARAVTKPASIVAFRPIDDAGIGRAAPTFDYRGTWETALVSDGRSGGSSTRSFHAGDRAVMHFAGSRVRLYGVTGPNGGAGAVRIDGRLVRNVDFHSARKTTNVLVFASPALARGAHTLDVTVEPPAAAAPHRRFVNLDGAALAP